MDFDIRQISQKWFSEDTPVNYKAAKATIAADDKETIFVFADAPKTDVVIEVVVAEAKSKPLSVALEDEVITITLGTTADAVVTADDTKNTLGKIATEISKLNGFTATASDGTSVIDKGTSADITFTDGNYGTPCLQAGVGLIGSEYYYVCFKSDNTVFNDGWVRFKPASY